MNTEEWISDREKTYRDMQKVRIIKDIDRMITMGKRYGCVPFIR